MDSMNDCLICKAPDKICDMVQCDTCELWAHYSCAGVKESAKELWSCSKCIGMLHVPRTRKAAKNDAKKSVVQKAKSDCGSSVGSISESAGTLEDSLKSLEKEQRAKEKALEEEMVLREKRLEMERALQEKRRQKEKEFREKQLQQDRELKKRQLQEEREMLEKELADEAVFQDQRKQMYQDFLEAKKAVAESADRESVLGDITGKEDETSFEKKVKFWLKKQAAEKNSPLSTVKPDEPVSGPSKQPLMKNIPVPREEDEEEGEDDDEKQGEDEDEKQGDDDNEEEGGDEENDEDEADEQFQLSREERELLARLLTGKRQKQQPSEKKKQPSEKQQPMEKKKKPLEKQQPLENKKQSPEKKKPLTEKKQPLGNKQQPYAVKLSTEQIAARQALSKNLPIFKGEPEMWPIFISSYEYTTQACGFSNLDNLKRLQDSLQGSALEAVRSRLVLPESVPDVIDDLRRLFGKPEKLLKTLLTKVRSAQAPKADRLESFIQFGITVKQLCDHLEAAHLSDHLNNPMLVNELVDKLPPNYKLEWVRYKRDRRGTPLRVFTDFTNDIVSDVSEVAEFSALGLSEAPFSGKGKPKKKEFVHVHGSAPNKSENSKDAKGAKPCWVCKRTDHKLRFCDDFKKLSITDRLKTVEQNKLCALCLNNHGKSRCNFKVRCNVAGCQGEHHPLLHRAEGAVQLLNVECHAHGRLNRAVIFRMVPVTLYFRNYAMDILAFLDEGSSTTLVEEFVVNELSAEGVCEPLVVTWTGNVKRYENQSKKVDLKLSARGSREILPLKNVRTVALLKLPSQAMQFEEIADRYSHLKDLPVLSYGLEEPRIIIGLDNLHLFAPLETRVGEPDQPIAVRSKLGWTVYGPGNPTAAVAESYVNVHSVEPTSNEDLYEMLRTQYLLEDTGTSCVPESAENLRAREILQATTVRKGDRFETGLLWRENEKRFPDSYPMAVRRLKALEKKLEKNPALKQNVHQQIEEYVAKGYAHKATEEELAGAKKNEVWYLPLNVVLNPRKPGKVRLVWDAAATVNGVSLNTELLKGPDMLQALPSVINLFRERRIAFGGDIQEMYHQMLMRAADKQALRFLFRPNPSEAPTVYVMDVATFGATCSPCSAQFIKNLNAAEFANEFPRASAAVIKNHYVDDYYDSVDSVDEAITLAKEVKLIHSRGGFHIRNWVSNSKEFLEAMGEQKLNPAVHFNRDKNTHTERVLGIVWDPEEDVFMFSTAGREEYQPVLEGVERPTKRIVLSCVMAMFDPQGFLSPFTVFGRMLVQDLWRTGCDWDEEIDDGSFQKWIRWTKVLPMIEAIRIPRSYFGDARMDQVEDLQLHVVTDASKGAYGCAAYFRAVVGGTIKCVLVTSRVKVAPLKPMSVPRLELQAAVLGARVASAVRDGHSLEIKQQFFWTDSTTVLSWIRSDQRKYKEFVGLRIGEILTRTNLSEWHWVPTKMNVADQLTKWTKDPEISSTSSWFTGPEFLYLAEADWPKQKLPRPDTEEELRAHLLVHDVNLPAPVIDIDRISKWTVLVRTMACVFRFVSNCRRKLNGLPLETLKPTEMQAQSIVPIDHPVLRMPLQQKEYEQAEIWLMRMAQADAFSNELKILMRNSQLPTAAWLEVEKSSYLYKFTPLIDEDGLLRMEGRAGPAEFLPFDLRFPIILPKDHAVTWKIVQHYHERFGHGYRETVKNELRQRFVIPQVGCVVAQVAKACIQCRVAKSRPRYPRMAALPVQRVTPYLRPFCFVGIDYFGPITVTSGRRSEKRWIVLFTCLVVRAVHLEVAHSLTTQSCLMAITRFISKRGPPLEVFSDNGTNLKGASKEVVQEVRSINEDCAGELTSARTKWNFNPPASPHMGGVWERLVRSTKDVLKMIDDGKRLTDEILVTAIAEAEDIINSRPLTYVAQESDHAEALSPNHFLRGVAPNEPRFNVAPVSPAVALRDSYQRSQEIADQMWKRWIKEYVPSINQRTKWFGETANLKKGDLVYIVEGDKRKCWVRGIVEEPIVAGDGRVRQALVRTNSGVLKRATAKLAVLEMIDGDAEPDGTTGPGSRAGACCGRSRRSGNAVPVAK